MPEQVIATPAVEVQAPPALNRSLADAVKAALSGQEQPKPAEAAKAAPEPSKPTVEVATRDKQGRFTQVGQPAPDETKTDEAKPAEHKAEHEKFIGRIAHEKAAVAAGKALSLELVHFLRDWLVQHIRFTDRAYADEFRNREKAAMKGSLGKFFRRFLG